METCRRNAARRWALTLLYAALSPVALASFAGEGTSHFGKAFLRSYIGVCMEGAVIVLACIIFSAFSSSGTPVVDSSASVVTQVWSYLGEVIFNLLGIFTPYYGVGIRCMA